MNKPDAEPSVGYGSFIYADLNHWLYRLLREHDTILISGYGWGDSGINQKLFEWFFLSPDNNRMILMHKEDEFLKLLVSFKDTLRPALLDLIKKGLVLKTGKWMSCTRAEEIFELLSRSRVRV